MAQPLPYDYYYGNEAEQYTFYRLPKALFTNQRYKNLSDGAKILYGLMLDRMGLSLKNGWLDEQNRVFIYFTLDDVTEQMNCKNDKGVKMLAELDTVKGVGLIERVKQGQGKPTIIFVRKFIDPTEVLTTEKPKSGLPVLPKSGIRENRSQDFGESECNKNYVNHTEINQNEQEQDQSLPFPSLPPRRYEPQERRERNETERMRMIEGYRSLVKENIEYDIIVDQYNRDQLDEMVELIVETVCSSRDTIRIASDDYPKEIVKSKFLKLNSHHIQFVFECLENNTTRVRNIKQYLLATLFNATTTIDSYYTALVNHDMYGGEF